MPAKALLEQGRQACLDGRFEAAAQLFLDACERDPLLDEAQAGLIGALESLGRHDLSVAALGSARIDRAGQRRRIDRMLLDQLPQQGAVLFDVGAHEGESILRLRNLFPQAEIHAFEPDPDLARRLAAKMQDDLGVHIVAAGLGQQEGQFSFHRHQDDATGSFVPLSASSPYAKGAGNQETGQAMVSVTTLDAYCAKAGVTFIDFLKLDVQGFEGACLQGAAGLLEKRAIGAIQVEIILADYYQSPGSFQDVERHLVGRGWRLAALFDIFPDLAQPLFQLDALYLPA
ncbi:MAG: FkbM family methyltransferase [Rhodospirillales bacterium]|nr:FkbM family methyltransferase [Rhodospirillales bacterium]